MAGTTTTTFDNSGLAGALRQVIIEHNKLVDDVEALRAKYAAALAKLDADAGVTDTNYVATQTVLAATLTAAKVGNMTGTAITT
jgi:hypothetical protein